MCDSTACLIGSLLCTSQVVPVLSCQHSTLRLFRHDGLGELFTSITAFKESGGIAAVVPNQQKGHRQMPWPQAVQEGTLQVYTNAHVQDLFIPKRGPGAVFMVRMDMTPPDLLVATNTHLSHFISHPPNHPWSHHVSNSFES